VRFGDAEARCRAQSLRPHQREIHGRGDRGDRLVRADVAGRLFARMCCSRVWSVFTKPRIPRASWVSPTTRPGIWRTSAVRQARIPRYGPPKLMGIPRGWPSPTAMSTPSAPGGSSSALACGSVTWMQSAPAACARPRSRGRPRGAERVGVLHDEARRALRRRGELARRDSTISRSGPFA